MNGWISLQIRRISPALAGASLLLAGGCPQANTPSSGSPTVTLRQIAGGLTSPIALATPHDGSGRLFVAEQVGRIRIIGADDVLRDGAFLDLSGELVELNRAYDERGLLGLAFHPNYRTNGRFFVFYSAPLGIDAPDGFDSQLTLSEFKVSADDANAADPASERVLLRIAHPQANHNGGQLEFGPDGFLYIGVGDGGASGDVGLGHNAALGNGQDKNTLLGKILRLNVDAGNPYAIPTDNPFVGAAGAREEIFAFGLRNPWKFSFAPDGRLFAGDVGQNLREEVDIVTRGGNFGWRIREGAQCFDKNNPGTAGLACANVDADDNPLIEPILTYPHAASGSGISGTAVIGGYVYRGSAVSALKGRYVFGDFSSSPLFGDGSLFAARAMDSGAWEAVSVKVANGANGRIGEYLRALGADENGELYVLTAQAAGPTGTTGKVCRIVSP